MRADACVPSMQYACSVLIGIVDRDQVASEDSLTFEVVAEVRCSLSRDSSTLHLAAGTNRSGNTPETGTQAGERTRQ